MRVENRRRIPIYNGLDIYSGIDAAKFRWIETKSLSPVIIRVEEKKKSLAKKSTQSEGTGDDDEIVVLTVVAFLATTTLRSAH